MTTGERIKERRITLGMSAEQIAIRMDVSAATVYRWENGQIEKVSGDRLNQLAEILMTTPHYLMGWADSPAKESDSAQKATKISDSGEQRLIDMYRQLNPEGQDKLLGNADDLIQSGKYRIDLPTAGNGGTHAV